MDSKNKAALITSLIVVGALVLFSNLGSESPSKIPSNTPEKTTNHTEPIMTSNWEYDSSVNKMNDKPLYFAQCHSQNSFSFDFPYNQGDVTATLLVRKMGKKYDLIVSISQGQILDQMLASPIEIRLDNNIATRHNYNYPQDLDSKSVFISNPSNLVAKIKTSKKLLVKIPCYNEGEPVFEFNVEGLEI